MGGRWAYKVGCRPESWGKVLCLQFPEPERVQHFSQDYTNEGNWGWESNGAPYIILTQNLVSAFCL